MQRLELREYEDRIWPGPLSRDQMEALNKARVDVSPTIDPAGGYRLRPSSYVGAVNVGDLSVIVRPKIPVDRVMFLMTYAMDPRHWRDESIDLAPDDDILEAVALAFVHRTQRAVRRGLLRGYRREEDALNTVRGQIRFADQIGRRYGLPLPIEVAYDEYTEDIEQNRLLKTAVHRLSHTRMRSAAVRQEVRRLRPVFGMVQLGSYAPGAAPEIRYTRLDEHYRPAVELARLIIENSSLELFGGNVTGASFLIDMNVVFERFLYVALGETLGLSSDQWQHQARLELDEGGSINMEPDLSWWAAGYAGSGPRPRFVGDAKYKKLDAPGFRHANIYQMLAYCIAADLPSGLLIYAAGEDEHATYRINHADKVIEVATLNLTGTPEDILGEVDRLAEHVRAHAHLAALGEESHRKIGSEGRWPERGKRHILDISLQT